MTKAGTKALKAIRDRVDSKAHHSLILSLIVSILLFVLFVLFFSLVLVTLAKDIVVVTLHDSVANPLLRHQHRILRPPTRFLRVVAHFLQC